MLPFTHTLAVSYIDIFYFYFYFLCVNDRMLGLKFKSDEEAV